MIIHIANGGPWLVAFRNLCRLSSQFKVHSEPLLCSQLKV